MLRAAVIKEPIPRDRVKDLLELCEAVLGIEGEQGVSDEV